MSAARDYLTGKTNRRSFVTTGGDEASLRCRRERILIAGALNDRAVLAELGSLESSIWMDGRSLADPEYVNPYWGSKGGSR